MDNKEKTTATVSRIVPDGTIIELVYISGEEKTLLAITAGGVIQYVQKIELASGEILVPLRASHNLIKHRVVLLPSVATEYGSRALLLEEIANYIRRYVTLSETFTEIAAHYALLSWVYDVFNEVPYLRWKGDFGSGKTRALAIIGSICYKPIFASGASTVSPIFHTLDLFKGALVFDEADFRFSDEKAEVTKIFNNGSVRGFPVLRASMNDKKDFDPRAFEVFGPKLIGMREVFSDFALESRFLTEEMTGAPASTVPISLPDRQREEALALRNKLLMFRMRERGSIKIDATLAGETLSARSNQILLPLLSVTGSDDVRARMRALAEEQAEDLVRSRSTSVEALILETIIELVAKREGAELLALADIRRAALRLYGHEFDRPLTSRFLGSVIRNKLRMRSYKSGVYMVRVPDNGEMRRLAKRFGVDSKSTAQ